MAGKNISWSDVVGIDEAKDTLMKTVITPLRTQGCNMPFTSILICAPPGTGKSYLRRAVNSEISDIASFWSKHSMEFFSKYIGFSKDFLKSFLQQSSETRPTVIWLDDLFSTDGMFPCAFCNGDEGETLSRYLTYWMNSNEIGKEGLVLIGATQTPWIASDYLLKSFEHFVFLDRLDEEARHQVLKRRLQSERHCLSEDDLWMIARLTDGFSGADISSLISSACMIPLRSITTSTHFKKVRGPSPENPSVMEDDLYTPCNPDDEGALAMSWADAPENKLLLPEITVDDFIKAVNNSCSSVSEKEWEELYSFKLNVTSKIQNLRNDDVPGFGPPSE
ncbi:vacuolar protein sorting-associated protein 4B-like [Glandiceps talaboti]